MKKLILFLFFGLSSLFAFEELHINNFDYKISKGKVIVDFYAVWWGSCKILGKNLHTYNKTTKAKDVKIFKVNIDKEKSLAKKYKINALPILIYFKDGKQVYKTAGVKTPTKLKRLEKKF